MHDAALLEEGNARQAETTTPVCVRDRADWARRRGHPDYLWPDVAIIRWRTALRGVEEAVRTVLAGRGGRGDACIAPVGLPADPVDTRAIGIAAFTSGLGPLLGRWIEDGLLRATPQATDLLTAHLFQGRRRATRMQGMLADAVAALNGAGLRPLVLKGLHTGAVYFPEPGARTAADIDLAVGAPELPAAEAALAALGWRLARRRRSPPGSEWAPPEPQAIRSLELTHADNPVSIDLHGGLERAFFGVRMLRFGAAPFETAAPLEGMPGALRLTQPHLLVFLAAHASEELHRLQLLRLVELVLVARRDLRQPADWTAVRDLTRDLDAGRFLLPAVELAERLAPGSMDAGWLADLRADATPRMRRVLATLQPTDAQRLEGLSLRDRFVFVRGPIEALRRGAYLLWPADSRRIGAVYAERAWRLLRGTVSVGD